MSINVDATYENGAFKLAEPVALPEGARVRLIVTTVEEYYDPLEEVIGICKEGPEISLAERHDEIIGGKPSGKEPNAS